MGKNIKCVKCGHLLATFSGEVGFHQKVKFSPGVRMRVEKNALGEDLGWARCPKCLRSRTRIDASFLPGTR